MKNSLDYDKNKFYRSAGWPQMSSFYLGWPIFDHKLSVFVNFGIPRNFFIIYKLFGLIERLKSYYIENSPCQDFECDDFIDDRKSSFFDNCMKLSVFDIKTHWNWILIRSKCSTGSKIMLTTSNYFKTLKNRYFSNFRKLSVFLSFAHQSRSRIVFVG